MTVTTLAQTIRHLPSKDRLRLFDKLRPTLEDYLLAEISEDRLRKSSKKRIPWEDLKS